MPALRRAFGQNLIFSRQGVVPSDTLTPANALRSYDWGVNVCYLDSSAIVLTPHRERSAANVSVPSGTGVAPRLHWTYIGKLEAGGAIQRQGDGFPLDQSRVAYLRYLRRERQQSPRAGADADHVKVKTEMLQLRLMQARRELVSREAHEAMIDQMAGLVLTKLGGWPARIAGADLGLPRRAEAVSRELRTEIAEACTKLADEQGEPPLDVQD